MIIRSRSLPTTSSSTLIHACTDHEDACGEVAIELTKLTELFARELLELIVWVISELGDSHGIHFFHTGLTGEILIDDAHSASNRRTDGGRQFACQWVGHTTTAAQNSFMFISVIEA